MDSHPEVLCHHEIFNPAGIHLALSRRGAMDLGSVADRDRDPAAVLARLWRHDFGCRAVGFKVTRETSPAAFAAVFAERGLKAIVLSRENRLRAFVSERIAALTGVWESYPGSEPAAGPVRIEVDPQELAAHAERNAGYYAGLRERLGGAGWQTLETTYEALSEDAERSRILGFLGASPGVPLSGSTRRQNGRRLSDLISNFGPLAAALEGGELEADLRERDLPAPPAQEAK